VNFKLWVYCDFGASRHLALRELSRSCASGHVGVVGVPVGEQFDLSSLKSFNYFAVQHDWFIVKVMEPEHFHVRCHQFALDRISRSFRLIGVSPGTANAPTRPLHHLEFWQINLNVVRETRALSS
jgi:hypothetical protein